MKIRTSKREVEKLRQEKTKQESGKQKKKTSKLHFHFRQEIRGMGYPVSGKLLVKTGILLYGCILAAGFFYHLHLPYLFGLFVLGTLCIPYHVYHTCHNRYEEQKWRTRLNYMEQMLSSFKRHPKLLEAYQDALTLFEREGAGTTDQIMAAAVRRAVTVIQTGDSGEKDSMYQNAAKEVEQEFGCHRLSTMHDYMEKVEQRGGEYKKAADLLLAEHALWKTNMESLRKEQKTKRMGVYIITGVCLAVSAFPAYLNKLMAGFTDNPLYQMCSTLFLCIVILQLVIAENKLRGWWNFDVTLADEERVLRNYHAFQTYDRKKHKKKAFLLAGCCYGLAAAGLVLHQYILVLLGAAYGLYLQRYPVIKVNALRRSVVKALEYQYPQWMMDMTLLLQTENVYISLKQSAKRAPKIIQEEIQKLTDRMDQEPGRVEPYNAFFADLHMDNVATSMRNLYSINTLGVEEEDALMRLIEHNNALMNQAEQIRGRERISMWTAYMYVPMLAGGIKIIMDTILLCAGMIASAVQSV